MSDTATFHVLATFDPTNLDAASLGALDAELTRIGWTRLAGATTTWAISFDCATDVEAVRSAARSFGASASAARVNAEALKAWFHAGNRKPTPY